MTRLDGMSSMITRCGVALAVLAISMTGTVTAAAPAAPAVPLGVVSHADDTLAYEPYGLVHDLHSAATVDGYLSDLDSYDVGQAFLQTPRFDDSGAFRLPGSDRTMLARWSSRAGAYNAAHGTRIAVTAVFNGQVKTTGAGLDLDDPDIRARMVEAITSLLATGVSGVHLDLEPFPMTPGYLSLLDELDASFARVGFHGRLSVVASGFAKWTPSYVRRVSRLVAQIDPMYYDSEYKTAAAYEAWVEKSLAYYTANSRRATRIVPVLPSYSRNPWHRPAVESIATATTALAEALKSGSRVNGAGIWWWWGFFYDEGGRYDASRDRDDWRSRTVRLPFSR